MSDAAAALGYVDRRKRDAIRSRAAIITAARADFAALGLNGARLDAIAARAGCDKRLIYHYFDDKDALYAEVLKYDFALLEEALADLDADASPVEGLTTFIDLYINFNVDNPDHARLLIQEELIVGRLVRPEGPRLRTRVFDILMGYISRGEEEGRFQSGLEPRRTVLTIAGACITPFLLRETLSDIIPPTQAEIASHKVHVTALVLAALR